MKVQSDRGIDAPSTSEPAGAMVLVLAPWTVRNFETFGRVIPVAQSSGYNLCKGFNPYTNGSGNMTEQAGGPGDLARLRIRAAVAPGPRFEPGDFALHASHARTARIAPLAERERAALEEALRRAQGNISETARLLGLSRAALYRRLDKHGL